jgi:NAD-dependent SIR2 family protein deacetylase
MLGERRVIPFLGAGFSAAHGLPDWGTLLREVANEVQAKGEENSVSYSEIRDACGDDNLKLLNIYTFEREAASALFAM